LSAGLNGDYVRIGAKERVNTADYERKRNYHH
jgi:hypothetical protein